MMKVLIVDDDSASRFVLEDSIREWKYEVQTASCGNSALEAVKSDPPALILLDIVMPGLDGYEVCRRLKSDIKTRDIPILFLTSMDEVQNKTKGFRLGAVDYITKPFEALEVKARIETHLSLKQAREEIKNHNVILEKKVRERTQKILLLNDELKQSLLNSVRVLVGLLEGYDSLLGSHSKRVSFLSLEIGRAFDLPKDEMFDLEVAALLHDIGKVSLPEKLQTTLIKDLSIEDQVLVKQHPIFAQSVLEPSEGLKKAGVLMRHHMEKWDGTGFPDGLQGTTIPVGAQIIGVANAYDEMKIRRTFIKGQIVSQKIERDSVLHYMEKLSGKYFDRDIVNKLNKVLEEIHLKRQQQVLLSISNLKPGCVLAANLFTVQGKLLFGKGSHLNAVRVEKLKAFHKAKLIEKSVYVFKFSS